MKQTIAAIGLILIAITAGVYHFSSEESKLSIPFSTESEDLVFDRPISTEFDEEVEEKDQDDEKLSSFFTHYYGPLLSYKITHNLQVHQDAKDVGVQQTHNLNIEAHCDVQAKYHRRSNIVSLAVSYHKIDKHGFEHHQDVSKDAQVITEGPTTSTATHDISSGEKNMGAYEARTHQDKFYLVEVEKNSGKVLSMKAENGVEEDDHMHWLTQQLVNDIMPESRKEAYEKQAIEEDNLGQMKVKYTASHHDHEFLKITKKYSHHDYIKQHMEHMVMPVIDHLRDVFLHKESGVVHRGNSHHKFEIGQKDGHHLFQNIFGHDHHGKFFGHIKQSFEKIASNENISHLVSELKRFRNEMEMHHVALHHEHKSTVEFGNGEHENLSEEDFINNEHVEFSNEGEDEYFKQNSTQRRLQQQIEDEQEQEQKGFLQAGQELYRHSHTMAQLKLFHQRVHTDLNYVVYDDKSSVEVDVKVNNRLVSKIASVTWNNCKNKPMDKDHEKTITLFKTTFKIFGAVHIPVHAVLKLQYGWKASLSGRFRGCEVAFKPYFRGDLNASGEVHIHKVMNAGIYSSGTFLSASLNFDMNSSHGKTHIGLSGDYKAIALSIGATYTKYNCSLKRLHQGFDNQQQQGEVEGVRRSLRHHHSHHFIKRAVHRIRHVVHKVVGVTKHVAKVVRSKVGSVVDQVCHKSQAYKQLYNKAHPFHHKDWVDKTFNFGL